MKKHTDKDAALLALKSVGALLILGGGIWFFMSSGSDEQTQSEADNKRWKELQHLAAAMHEQQQRQRVEQIINQAQRHLDEDDIQKSRTLIDEGLKLEPGHPQLLELRNTVEEMLTQRQKMQALDKRQHQVAKLLTQAEQYWSAESKLTPQENNIHEIYQQVLALEPENLQAKSGLVRLVSSFEQAARQRLQAGTMKESMNFIDAGLAVDPNHAGLHELRSIVEESQAELARKKAREKSNHKKFQKFLAEAKRSQASGALEKSLMQIKQGLRIYPHHAELLSLREKVQTALAQNKQQTLNIESRQKNIAVLLAQAVQSRDSGALEEGLSYVIKALQIDPQHSVLQEIHADLKVRLAEQKRQLEVEQRRLQEVDILLSRAEQHKHQGALTNSLDYIERGLQISPNHSRLLELQEEVLAQQRQEEHEMNKRDTPSKATDKPKRPRVFGTF
ncbi:MAG TPA: hypothetical protein ENI98_07890 [Gammaproteobacteria bacterium]|nr:hypothetical protein [Gammaproteobacteria bacterium]